MYVKMVLKKQLNRQSKTSSRLYILVYNIGSIRGLKQSIKLVHTASGNFFSIPKILHFSNISFDIFPLSTHNFKTRPLRYMFW